MNDFYEIVKVEKNMEYYFPGLASIFAKREGRGETIEIFEDYDDAKKALDEMHTIVTDNLIIEYYLQRVDGNVKYFNDFSIKKVDLKGTEKQIKYANDIKRKGYREMLSINVLGRDENEVKKAVKAAEAIDSLTDASEIIEHADGISYNTDIDDIVDYKKFKDMLNIDTLMSYKDAEITFLYKNIKTGKIRERKLEHSRIQRFSASNGYAVFEFLHSKTFPTRGVPIKCDGNYIYLKNKSNYIAITFKLEGE